jgi:SAM-dependent methyltransferase
MTPRAVLQAAAASIDLPASLLPFAGELFAGLDALGSTPRRAVNMLERAGVGPGDRVVDLGCGKGAVAVEAAARLGCRVVGVDAIETFVESARALAQHRGAGRLCRFHVGDQHAVRGRFDAALSIGVMPLDAGAALCRGVVRRGGVYVLDDVVRLESVSRARGLGAPTQREAVVMIERGGDRVEQRITPTPKAMGRLNDRLYAVLARSAAGVGREHPRLRPALRAFLERQRDANRVLTGPLRPTLWLVRAG